MVALIDRFPTADDRVIVNSLFIKSGGGSNTAVGLARLGVPVRQISLIGDDKFGSMLIADLNKEGVDTSKIIIRHGASGIAFCAVKKNGERNLYVHYGVGETLSEKDVNFNEINNAEFLYLSGMNGSKIIDVYQRASALTNTKTIFDPGCLAEKGLGKLQVILKNSYVFMPNELEAEMLTGMKGVKAAETLLKAGSKIVILKQGSEGCILAMQGAIIPVSTDKVNAVDTTGAGNAFAAGFIEAQLKGKDLLDSCKYANMISALSVKKIGARTIPSGKEIDSIKRKFDIQ